MTGEGILVRGVMRTKINQVSPFIREIKDPNEYMKLLRKKLLEEVGELLTADDSEIPEECADVLQVLYDIAEDRGYSRHDLENIRNAKNAEKGDLDAVMAWSGN
jgi:predicted house-cleaning noncanonical NTP pyrophosphatase (MazG superfamily)